MNRRNPGKKFTEILEHFHFWRFKNIFEELRLKK